MKTKCSATNRRGAPCGNPAINGTSKCKYHGGKSLSGIAHPGYKDGRHSKHLPSRLAGLYAAALADSHLLELRDDLALIDTRQAELLARLDSGLALARWKNAQAAYRELSAAVAHQDTVAFQVAMTDLSHALDATSQDYQVWGEICELIEQRRRLVEGERKHLIASQQMISSERLMLLLGAVVGILREHIHEPSTLAAISSSIAGLISQPVGAAAEPLA